MEETLKLIQLTLDKVTLAGHNITQIASDAKQLGDNIQVIDTAMKEVETSNLHLVNNLEQVTHIVSDMTDRIADSNEISSRMVSKYTESAENIDSIEKVIGALMCELGIGGFMGTEDIQPGMKLAVFLDEHTSYHGEIIAQKDNTLTVSLPESVQLSDPAECKLQVTVGNVLYRWNHAKLSPSAGKDSSAYMIQIESRPKINNRRKYPRMDLTNRCSITIVSENKVIEGKLDNISANGFAFLCDAPFFADSKGPDILLNILSFDLPDQAALEGHIIRCSDNEGLYIVGCQMPEDNFFIRDYVKEHLQ